MQGSQKARHFLAGKRGERFLRVSVIAGGGLKVCCSLLAPHFSVHTPRRTYSAALGQLTSKVGQEGFYRWLRRRLRRELAGVAVFLSSHEVPSNFALPFW